MKTAAHAKERAEYGAALLKNLSIRLSGEFGAGFDGWELRRMRQFYLSSPIRGALRPELPWTHSVPPAEQDTNETNRTSGVKAVI